MLKAVGFDFDGILVRNIDPNARARAIDFALENLCASGEYEGESRARDVMRGEKYEDFFRRVLKCDAEGAAAAVKLSDDYYLSQGLDKIKQPIAESVDAMRTLKKNGIAFFIASNNPSNKLYYDAFFRAEFGDVPMICASYDNKLPVKPAPDIILKGFEAVGVEPNPYNTMFVGDRVHKDVLASINANTFPVLVYSEQGEVERHAANAGLKIQPLMSFGNSSQMMQIEHQGGNFEFAALGNHSRLRNLIVNAVNVGKPKFIVKKSALVASSF